MPLCYCFCSCLRYNSQLLRKTKVVLSLLTCRSLQVDLLVGKHEDADTFWLENQFGYILEDNTSSCEVCHAFDLQCVVSIGAVFWHL